MLTVGSLFSGIGGLELGLERAGMRVRWQVERDLFCRRVLATHWPEVSRHDDVTTIQAGDLEPVDLICGGFPCQPVSVAGQRKGAEDERWLWPEFLQIIRLVGPRYVVVENVPGLLTHDGGRTFGGILGDLAESGFDAEWDCVSASALGALHQRDRVFLVAYAHGGRAVGDRRDRDDIERKAEAAIQERQDVELGDDAAGQRPTVVADAESERELGLHLRPGRQNETASVLDGLSEAIRGVRGEWADWWATDPADVADADDSGREEPTEPEPSEAPQSAVDAACRAWRAQPYVGRVADGVPARVAQLRSFGNAIVPQVAEAIGRAILTHARETSSL